MNHNTRTANDLGDAGCAWPVEKKGLDALDRELALLISVKRWVAGATGGITPRSLEKNYPCNDKKSNQKTKHVDYVFQQRCVLNIARPFWGAWIFEGFGGFWGSFKITLL